MNDFLKDQQEDIYTIADGKPFHDPEYIQSVVREPNFCSITDSEEDGEKLSNLLNE